MSEQPKICVVGLGYVGLPLAVGLARHFAVTGFDVNSARVGELRDGFDRTREIDAAILGASGLRLSDDAADIADSNVFIIAVPTPVAKDKTPDLGAVLAATRTVGGVMGRDAIVVFESTVYPGVTEEVCGPVLEEASGLTCGADFFLGYSPERINPGDKEHTIERITKVVAGQNETVTDRLMEIYGRLTNDNVFRARDIQTAEAAKVIENAQRDINLAFVNEVAMILGRQGLSVYDVLEAAETKWNFLPFRPGLVGGHCIGVDPYYLAYLATKLDHDPEIILAGRRINDGMGDHVAACVAERLAGPGRVLVLGLTFKENVPDLRNSRVSDVIHGLVKRGHDVDVHDAFADGDEARALYDVALLPDLHSLAGYDALVGAVPHDVYRQMGPADMVRLLAPHGLVADIKGMWRKLVLPEGLRRWQL
ncbi:MAG: nucleotide sugar dehydrogenase [Alphaproteobacteria bacterium]